jgi:tryptophan synthase beta subunit
VIAETGAGMHGVATAPWRRDTGWNASSTWAPGRRARVQNAIVTLGATVVSIDSGSDAEGR